MKTLDKLGKDPFLFAKLILGFEDLIDLNREWLELAQESDRLLILGPRKHYKSTTLTVSDAIWRLWLNPTLRILILSSTSSIANGFMRQISGLFRRRRELREIWKWRWGIYPVQHIEEWTKEKITFMTFKAEKEPSLVAAGAMQEPVSWHFDLLKLDDVVDKKDRFERATREKKKLWFQDLESLLNEGGKIHIIGSRWHTEELYSMILQGADFDSYMKKTYTIKKEDGSYWLQEMTPEREAELRAHMGLHFFAQYYNDPRPDQLEEYFSREAFQLYDPLKVKILEAKIYIDPASTTKATSSDTAIVAVGKGKDKLPLYILNSRIGKITETRFTKEVIKVIELLRELGIERITIGLEAINFQKYLKKPLKQALMKEGFAIPIKLIYPREPKLLRIQKLEPYISSGSLLLPRNWRSDGNLSHLISQLEDYPRGSMDGPDALSGAMALFGIYSKPVMVKPKEDIKIAEVKDLSQLQKPKRARISLKLLGRKRKSRLS